MIPHSLFPSKMIALYKTKEKSTFQGFFSWVFPCHKTWCLLWDTRAFSQQPPLPVTFITTPIVAHQKCALKSYICKLTLCLAHQEDLLKKQALNDRNCETHL